MSDIIRQGLANALRGLFRYWVYSLGSVVILCALPLIAPPIFVPLVGLVIALVFHYLIRTNVFNDSLVCHRVLYVANVTLVWASLVMITMYILMRYTTVYETMWLKDLPVNPRIPFIPILIFTPIAAIISGWVLFRGHKHSLCETCFIKHGDLSERGFIGQMFAQESNYQLWLIFGLSLFVFIGEMAYYIFFFNNVNLNTPDTFYFVWVPAILFGLSVLYLTMRYYGLYFYYNRTIEGSPMRQGSYSKVRFLIICGDELFLSVPADDSSSAMLEDDKIETPAAVTIDYRKQIPLWDAEMFFQGIAGIKAPSMRYLYVTNFMGSGSNVFHFAAVFDDHEELEKSHLKGQWFNLPTLQMMIAFNKVSPLLTSEVMRIYNVTMAWKTYDNRGYRLYDIKNYKPSFRLRDFAKWNVDYDDPKWLLVASNNQDRPFFRLRRLWRKFVNGISPQ